MENEDEICTISIGDGLLDDDYTFYEDGRIKRFYDKNNWSYNITEFITPRNISGTRRDKIIGKCPAYCLERIMRILDN